MMVNDACSIELQIKIHKYVQKPIYGWILGDYFEYFRNVCRNLKFKGPRSSNYYPCEISQLWFLGEYNIGS